MIITENQLRKIIRNELVISRENAYSIDKYGSINLLEQAIKREVLINEVRAIKKLTNFAKQKFKSINDLRKKIIEFGNENVIKMSFFVAFLDLYVYLSHTEWAMIFPDEFPEFNLVTGGFYGILGIIGIIDKYYKRLEKESKDEGSKKKESAKKILDIINRRFKADKLIEKNEELKSKKVLDIEDLGW